MKGGNLTKNYHRKSKYSDEEIKKAVNYYLNHGKSISRTIRNLGYPSSPEILGVGYTPEDTLLNQKIRLIQNNLKGLKR